MTGILVHGDNHFIVEGPEPDRETAQKLVRQWSIIQIGRVEQMAGWKIRTKAYREDLAWAVVIAGERPHSPAITVLLDELATRGVAIRTFAT
ncbi:MAG: hypothetical protein HYX27_26365 [Acidobacteria bacterium]|nr:hypothetical protein [Acidobacteriota bacterium]